MNQKELADIVAEKFNIHKCDMYKIVDSVINTIIEALAKGEKVRLVGFGNFTVKTRKGRTGRNPRTGEKIDINPTKCAVFTAGYNLKKAIRGQ